MRDATATLVPLVYDAVGDEPNWQGAPDMLVEALDCLRVAVTLYDNAQRLTYANRHFAHLFPQFPDAAQLIGRSYGELVALEIETGAVPRPDAAHGLDAYVAARCTQLSSGDFAPRDIRLSTGQIIEIKARRTPSGWIVLWSDATRAREAFGRLEIAVEMSADAFAFWDPADRLVMWNVGFARLHGCEDDANLTGRTYLELLNDVVVRGLVRLDEPEHQFIGRRMRAHHAEAGAAIVRMERGQAYLVRERMTADGGRATVFTDITDRARAETAFAEQGAALSATQEALDRQNAYLASLIKRLDAAEQGAQAAKTTFLRTMSHELKTPLNAIIGFSDLLRSAPERFSRAQVGEYADLIHRAGGNLLTMLNQILDLTKIAAGRFVLRREPVSVRLLFDRALDAHLERAEDKAVTLAAEAGGELVIDGDEEALAALVLELVNNAVSFTHNGGQVTLSAWREGSMIALRVADNGPGVDDEHLPRLAEPFEQAGRDTAAHRGGAGLGLTLVKALAELHGGRLELQSRLGEGFAATIYLPEA